MMLDNLQTFGDICVFHILHGINPFYTLEPAYRLYPISQGCVVTTEVSVIGAGKGISTTCPSGLKEGLVYSTGIDPVC